MSRSHFNSIKNRISHLIDRIHLGTFTLRIILWLTQHADLPLLGKIIRLSGNLYTRYLIHGKTLIDPHSFLRVHDHSNQSPHTVIDHENALKMIQQEKDLCVVDCMCRLIGKNCKSPLKTCILVGTEAYRRNSIHPEQAITAEKAARILKSSFDQNLIHNAIYVMGNLVEICNCCKCCCLPIIGAKKGFKSLLPSNYLAFKIRDHCANCGICDTVCPFDAIHEGRINTDQCYGCGLCAFKCPEEVIEMVDRKPQLVACQM